MKTLKVAVIGSGMIANLGHIPAWQTQAGIVEVVAVANPGKESGMETARRFGIPNVFTDPQKMLDEIRPDIVSVCSPNVSHKQWVIAALQAGSHVLCEKPLATSLQDAEEMFAAADSAGRMLYVAQSQRFRNYNQAAKKYITAGALGEVYFAEASYLRRRGIPTWGKFHMKEHNAGGPLWDLGVHVVDFLVWVLGNPPVSTVSGSTYTKIGNRDEGLSASLSDSGAHGTDFSRRPYDYREFDVEDSANGYIRLKNGGSILLKVSWAINLPESSGIQIAGTEGGMQLPPLKLLTNQQSYPVEILPKVPEERPGGFPGHLGLVENFLKTLQGEQDMLVKREEVLGVIRIIEGLYHSAAEGKEIPLF
jgi:predicted dehydrogenase